MPTYCYSCSSCGAEFERRLHMDQHSEPISQPCQDCGMIGHIEQVLQSFSLGNPISMGHIRTPAGFTQVLDKIHKNAGVRGPRKTKFSETREI